MTYKDIMERDQKVVELVQHHTYEEVGSMFGITRQRVEQILRKHRLPSPRPRSMQGRFRQPQHLHVVELAKTGRFTGRDIAKITGYAIPSVAAILREHGVSLLTEKRRLQEERVRQYVETQG